MDIGGISRDGRVPNELGSCSLRQAVRHPHSGGFPARSRQ